MNGMILWTVYYYKDLKHLKFSRQEIYASINIKWHNSVARMTHACSLWQGNSEFPLEYHMYFFNMWKHQKIKLEILLKTDDILFPTDLFNPKLISLYFIIS